MEAQAWWANTPTNTQAKSRLGVGLRVMEVRMGESVAFSPSGDVPAVLPKGQKTPQPILDGVAALSEVLERTGYRTITEAVAAHTVFLHLETVMQTQGEALYPVVRDPTRRGQFDKLATGEQVMFDENTTPTSVFLWSAQRSKCPDIQYNHVWGDPKNSRTYTALWNLCAIPAFLAKTTDGSNHPDVLKTLRYRAFDLYGLWPDGENQPERPTGYDELVWPEPPPPVEDLEAVVRKRMTDAPKGRPAVCGRLLGWLYSNGPDNDLQDPAN